jgi:hypothetical protein
MQLLETEILPELTELRKEKTEYMAWQQACADVDMLVPLIRSFRYYSLLQLYKKLLDVIRDAEQQEQQYEEELQRTQVSLR